MIVDAHAHLRHGDVARTEYDAQTIVRTMDGVGIDKSVVFAICTSSQRSIEMARRAVEAFPDRLIPFAYALPSFQRPVLEALDEAISVLGFWGIKVHSGECSLADYVIDPVLELAGRRAVVCLVDCGGDWEGIKRLAASFPQTKILVAHFGKYLCPEGSILDRFIGLAESYPNVYLDTSGVLLSDKIREAVSRLGPQRVVFGTDGPHQKPDTVLFAQGELDRLRSAGLSPEDEDHVLGRAALELLGLA